MVRVIRVAQQDIGADYGFDPGRLGRAVEFHQCKQVVLIGDRNGGHAKFDGFFNQGLDSNRAVDQRKFRMQVQMNERCGHEMGSGSIDRLERTIVPDRAFIERNVAVPF